MTNRLSEKVCIITGTGGGMGREAALIFAREGALIAGCGFADFQAFALNTTLDGWSAMHRSDSVSA